MPAYFMVQLEITDVDRFKDYASKVPATVEKYGGRYLVRGGKYEVLEGEWPERRHVVLEFPSVAQARAWYDSDDYAPLKALRLSASSGAGILIEGVAP